MMLPISNNQPPAPAPVKPPVAPPPPPVPLQPAAPVQGDQVSSPVSQGKPSSLSLPDPVVVAPWTPPDQPPEVTIYQELGKAADGPGEMFNMMSKKHLEDVRGDFEDEPPATGVRYEMVDDGDGPRAHVTGFVDISAPDCGTWDPTQYAPHYVFDAQEDAFPVRPDFDGNGTTSDNASSDLEGTGSDHYQDGVIGGNQSLNSAFVVQQKGEYTVLTYSNYYATNKGADYHKNDYSTAQIYLKPNEQGKLEPAFLATSWHYGTVLTPWKDVQKDAQGHPLIGVGLGTHSLQPFGQNDPVPSDGLHILGDGSTTLNGQPTEQRLTYDAFQTNVDNATILSDPDSDRATARRTTLGYGWAAADPLHPSTFNNDNTWDKVEDRLSDDLEDVEDHGGENVEAWKQEIIDNARKVEEADEDVPKEKSLLEKIGGFFGL